MKKRVVENLEVNKENLEVNKERKKVKLTRSKSSIDLPNKLALYYLRNKNFDNKSELDSFKICVKQKNFDVNYIDKNGETIFQLALETENNQIKELLNNLVEIDNNYVDDVLELSTSGEFCGHIE